MLNKYSELGIDQISTKLGYTDNIYSTSNCPYNYHKISVNELLDRP